MAASGMRAFGQQAVDLDHDFASADRPALVTALLETCSTAPGVVDWWQQALSRRIAALLDLALLSRQGRALTLTLRCDAPQCGQRFEIELPAVAWARIGEAATLQLGDDAAPLTLRLPTGADLRACREQALQQSEPADLAHSLLQRLCLAGLPRQVDAESAAQALAEADPLVAFSVHCACPECGDALDRPVDLEAEALARLAACQAGLLDEVHRLASHYGWSEREIFEVAPARRRLYLQAIAAGEEVLR